MSFASTYYLIGYSSNLLIPRAEYIQLQKPAH